jgi:hypothetical protein
VTCYLPVDTVASDVATLGTAAVNQKRAQGSDA